MTIMRFLVKELQYTVAAHHHTGQAVLKQVSLHVFIERDVVAEILLIYELTVSIKYIVVLSHTYIYIPFILTIEDKKPPKIDKT